MNYIRTMLALFCFAWLLFWSCIERGSFVLLCPSSLAHWLVGFWSGDSHCSIFVRFFLFLVFWPVYFLVVFLFLFCFCFFWPVYFFCFISVFVLFFNLFSDFQSLLASACHNSRPVLAPWRIWPIHQVPRVYAVGITQGTNVPSQDSSMLSAHICFCAPAQTSSLQAVRGQLGIVKHTQEGPEHVEVRGLALHRLSEWGAGAGIRGPSYQRS